MRTVLFVAMAALASVLAGCALRTPPTHTEVVEQALPMATHIPPAWKADLAAAAVTNGWLKSFNDPVLEAIVAEALANNPDLHVAASRVAIAQQTVIRVGAQLLPQINAQLGASTTDDSGSASRANSTIAFASSSPDENPNCSATMSISTAGSWITGFGFCCSHSIALTSA